MANTKDIRAKITSTTKTQQTTSAMKVVSAAKLKKAQAAIVGARPYALALRKIIQNIATSQNIDHPLLRTPEATRKRLVVVLTSDRGLCGAFNANIIKYAQKYLSSGDVDQDVIFVGRKGADFFKKHGIQGIDTILGLSKTISFQLAEDVSERVLQQFLSGEYDEVRMIYNEFKSAISQDVVDERLLPVRPEDVEAEEATVDYVFEPAPKDILHTLLRKHFATQIFRIFQESVASEHGARMAAMENATRNAGEMIKGLTLHYNKVRQASITTELIEITSGAEALKG